MLFDITFRLSVSSVDLGLLFSIVALAPSLRRSRCYYDNYLKRRQWVGVPYSSEIISFLEFCRLANYDHEKRLVKARFANPTGRHAKKQTCAIGVTYSYELLDIFLGQFASMNIPHDSRHVQDFAIELVRCFIICFL